MFRCQLLRPARV